MKDKIDCPVCGADAEIIEQYETAPNEGGFAYLVSIYQCCNCGRKTERAENI